MQLQAGRKTQRRHSALVCIACCGAAVGRPRAAEGSAATPPRTCARPRSPARPARHTDRDGAQHKAPPPCAVRGHDRGRARGAALVRAALHAREPKAREAAAQHVGHAAQGALLLLLVLRHRTPARPRGRVRVALPPPAPQRLHTRGLRVLQQRCQHLHCQGAGHGGEACVRPCNVQGRGVACHALRGMRCGACAAGHAHAACAVACPLACMPARAHTQRRTHPAAPQCTAGPARGRWSSWRAQPHRCRSSTPAAGRPCPPLPLCLGARPRLSQALGLQPQLRLCRGGCWRRRRRAGRRGA